MAEDIARAVGAGSDNIVIIAGKECQPRPLSIRELTELERDCLTRYKREYIKTFTDNMDLLPGEDRMSIVREVMESAAKWDLTSLPDKWAYDVDSITITPKLDQWLEEYLGFDESAFPSNTIDMTKKRLTTSSLDDGSLSEAVCESLTKTKPRKAKVRYVEWWITGCMDGMVSMIWMCLKPQVTRDEVATELGTNPSLISNLAREIEALSVPSVGNG